MTVRHVFGLRATLAAAAIALAFASPSMAQSAPPAPSVAGTTWGGADSDGDYYDYTFRPDGVLAYKYSGGSFTNGTWKQFGDVIYMETNHKYSERQGTIAGTHIDGNAWNVQGHEWTWSADKK
jgi:hypothetical protein